MAVHTQGGDRARAGLRRAWAYGVGVVAGLALSACFTGAADLPPLDTTDGTTVTPLLCEPGDAVPCTCNNGASGEKMCDEGGFSTGACVCSPVPATTAASTTLPPPQMGDSSG
ncbi:MAG: hypothetical protein AAF721_41720, partial [Myxococcota bacterium]